MANALKNVLSKEGLLRSKYFDVSSIFRISEVPGLLQRPQNRHFSTISVPILTMQRQSRDIKPVCDLRYPTCYKTLGFRTIYKVRYSTSTQSERNCWKCGLSNRSYEELFFCKCGIVQKLPDDITYFEMLNSEQKFDIDLERLSQIYKHLQSRLHPDKFTLKSTEEQGLAEKQSAFINKAYFTLLKPLTRGLYLLELWGNPLEESNSAVNQDFLLEMMEMNEDVDDAKTDLTTLKTLEDINNAQMEACVTEVSEYFQTDRISEAKSSLIKLKYYTNISDKIKDIYRSHM